MLLQKKDNEGFGFVLRGAKGEPLQPHLQYIMFSAFMNFTCFFPSFYFPVVLLHFQMLLLLICVHSCSSFCHLRSSAAQTPIEEFTPTPAFPALQYLESVDEGGVAWRAGLRMGDFLIEVYGQDAFWTNPQTKLTLNESCILSNGCE